MKIGIKCAVVFCFCLVSGIIPVYAVNSAQYEEAVSMMRKRDFDGALELAKKMEKENPENPESYTLQSSIMLSTEYEGGFGMVTNTDESIFERPVAYMTGGPMTLNRELAGKSEKLLLKSLEKGPDWDVGYYTICHMYSISYNTDKLIGILKKMKKQFPGNEEMINNLGNYAENLYDRGDFESCVKVYKALIEMYPDRSLFLNDLGAHYAYQGKMKEAADCARKAAAMDDADYITAVTSRSILTICGEYGEGLKAAAKYSKIKKNDYVLAYRGLYNRLMGIEGWKNDLMKFVRSEKAEKNDKELIKAFLEYKPEGGYAGPFEIEADRDLYNLIMEIFASGKNNSAAKLDFAYRLLHQKHYERAAKMFAAAEAGVKEDEKEEFYTYYAWALQASGNHKKADIYWEKLTDNGDFFVKSAAIYFLGKNRRKEDPETAALYFSKISDRGDRSKYGNLAKAMLENIDNPGFEFDIMERIDEKAQAVLPANDGKEYAE